MGVIGIGSICSKVSASESDSIISISVSRLFGVIGLVSGLSGARVLLNLTVFKAGPLVLLVVLEVLCLD